jgi:hypothetical protein
MRNEIEVAPISSALLRIACLVILYKTCRVPDQELAADGVLGPVDYLSKMKIAVMVRQLDLGHILWCGRVVRVERAHRVRVVRGLQKMPDVGNGVIGFDHVRFHIRDLVMAFLEDELVRCCVTHFFIAFTASASDPNPLRLAFHGRRRWIFAWPAGPSH